MDGCGLIHLGVNECPLDQIHSEMAKGTSLRHSPKRRMLHANGLVGLEKLQHPLLHVQKQQALNQALSLTLPQRGIL